MPPKPGTELSAILKDWMGIEPTPGCPCKTIAGKMDAQGPDWCESPDGMAEIVASMKGEHARRWEAGEIRIPFTEFGARQLIHLACRRARQNSR